ncbi:unnamed protein product [Acanthoscelides obtectus]|uniref:Uncharacterized protein n=1 Tax=Acanthoscelides obtectus TaxID=200917 RepID=A0A9P0PWL0_ACAOB|nr:unnamed protein product [Acanthoscelides obtectus]CAK1668595.1 GATOR complex protein MIOS-A [Acanthoscelides obtectus]
MTGKLEIQWSPIENKFITWGAGICLYEVYSTLPESVPSSNVFKISESRYAELKTTNGNFNYTRSIDIYPKCEVDLLLAIGLTNGRVSLATFNPSPEHDIKGYVGKELGKESIQVNVFHFIIKCPMFFDKFALYPVNFLTAPSLTYLSLLMFMQKHSNLTATIITT